MSNLGLDIAMRKRGIRLEKTAVGDRYVLERMKQGGFAIGGEQSGHVILLHQQTTGDGLVSALYLLGSLRRAGKPLSELAGTVQVLPQILINPGWAATREAYKRDSTIMDEIARIEAKYQGEGRVLIRPLGHRAVGARHDRGRRPGGHHPGGQRPGHPDQPAHGVMIFAKRTLFVKFSGKVQIFFAKVFTFWGEGGTLCLCPPNRIVCMPQIPLNVTIVPWWRNEYQTIRLTLGQYVSL